jgi:hypothetical protein
MTPPGSMWKRSPRMPALSRRRSSASETRSSTTATPRALAPIVAIASSVQELSVPYPEGCTTTLRSMPSLLQTLG